MQPWTEALLKRLNRGSVHAGNSPLSHGITLWDWIPEPVQRSTTKVRFKQGIKSHLSELIRPVLK